LTEKVTPSSLNPPSKKIENLVDLDKSR